MPRIKKLQSFQRIQIVRSDNKNLGALLVESFRKIFWPDRKVTRGIPGINPNQPGIYPMGIGYHIGIRLLDDRAGQFLQNLSDLARIPGGEAVVSLILIKNKIVILPSRPDQKDCSQADRQPSPQASRFLAFYAIQETIEGQCCNENDRYDDTSSAVQSWIF